MQIVTKTKGKIASLVVVAALGMGASSNALAAVTFDASSGNLAASASFDVVGGNLQITLINTSLSDVLVPSDILTALFFDLSPATELTPLSATLGSGSTVLFGSLNGGNMGGEWAFGSGLTGTPGKAMLGASSSGLGLFGQANFGGSNLQGPTAVNGLQYGITSAGDNALTGNAPVTGGYALIQNSVVFTLSGNPALTAIDDYVISHVSFQYGTDLSEPNIPGVPTIVPVPEPTTMIAGLLLLLPFAASTFRFIRRRQAE